MPLLVKHFADGIHNEGAIFDIRSGGTSELISNIKKARGIDLRAFYLLPNLGNNQNLELLVNNEFT